MMLVGWRNAISMMFRLPAGAKNLLIRKYSDK